MANETTTTSANDPIFVSWVTSKIHVERRPYYVSKPLFDIVGPGLPTTRYDWPTQTDPGEASDLTEGTAMANTQLATGVASATAAADGQSATVTKLLQKVMVTDANAHFAKVLGRSVAEAEENEASVLYDGFSNQTGTTTADLTVAQFHQAVNQLEQRDAIGKLAAVLHPQQTGDLRTGIQVTTNANFHANPQLSQNLMQDIDTPSGMAGSLFGVDIWHTSAVPTVNTAADVAGAVFVVGDALGWYDIWALEVEFHPDVQQPGDIIAATSCRGVVEIFDAWGQAIVSDAP